jgi:hypothetical protein
MRRVTANMSFQESSGMIPCARDELVGESEPYLLPAVQLSVDVYEASLFKTWGQF